jgi:NAD(P)-dependent dehydrogenase (short-subunit alcohol dehydrogenase family)
MNHQDWRDRRVLITGASQGLGAALAEALAAKGAALALVARTQGPLDQLVERLRARGGRAYGIVADVADKEATHRIWGQAAALLGGVDVLIHNASTLGPVPLRPLLDTACEDLGAVLETNVVGPFRLTKAVVAPMVLRGSGLVLFISSDAAVEAYPGWGSYGTSKAAADHLARVLAAEVTSAGVRVVSVDPGEMRTKMHRDALPEADEASLSSPTDVARSVLALMEDATGAPSGSRVSARQWRPS